MPLFSLSAQKQCPWLFKILQKNTPMSLFSIYCFPICIFLTPLNDSYVQRLKINCKFLIQSQLPSVFWHSGSDNGDN